MFADLNDAEWRDDILTVPETDEPTLDADRPVDLTDDGYEVAR